MPVCLHPREYTNEWGNKQQQITATHKDMPACLKKRISIRQNERKNGGNANGANTDTVHNKTQHRHIYANI